MRKFRVTINPGNSYAEFNEGILLTEALAVFGVFPDTPCGGKGICGKCLVDIEDKSGRRPVKSCNYVISSDLLVFKPDLQDNKDSFRVKTGTFAVDIGTTVVKISALIDGKFTEAASFLNPQRIFGHDVISRIASREYAKMSSYIRNALAENIKKLSVSTDDIQGISDIAISGNTLMLALFCGINPDKMGTFPYAAPIEELDNYRGKLNELNDSCRVKILPCFTSFLGADFLGCAYYAFENFRGKTFICDMGTNAEMAFISDDSVYASSVPLGPAVEGMNLSCGMTAGEGAIISATGIYPRIEYKLYSGVKALGIAASGLADIFSVFIKTGQIDKNGRIINGDTSPEGESCIYLRDEVYISQKDVRSVQLVKSACRSGAEILSEKSGFVFTESDNVILAGSFASSVNSSHVFSLGFFPHAEKSEVTIAGNLSLKSAEYALINPGYADELKEFRKKIKFISLTDDASFEKKFYENISF